MLSIMKTFLNVLYRRILYKIPLKFLLILLAIWAILFASCNANEIQYSWNFNIQYISNWSFITPIWLNVNYDNQVHNYTINCQFSNLSWFSNIDNFQYHLRLIRYISPNWFNNTEINNCIVNNNNYNNFTCDFSWININSVIFNKDTALTCTSPNICWIDYTCRIISDNIINNQNSCDYSWYLTQWECDNLYSWYVLESSIDSAYCENNWLCSSSSSWDVSWSALYINNIQHLWWPNIFITIPEEIGRDYNYNDYDDMFISVSGYNVDYDKITGIIDVQNYKPSQEDFNNIIWILADYMPIIVIFLWLLFIYKMIRKPFKSKL